eukprot:15359556-Ditylum_brightwellii.AAC.1
MGLVETGRKRIELPMDDQLQYIFRCNFPSRQFACTSANNQHDVINQSSYQIGSTANMACEQFIFFLRKEEETLLD